MAFSRPACMKLSRVRNSTYAACGYEVMLTPTPTPPILRQRSKTSRLSKSCWSLTWGKRSYRSGGGGAVVLGCLFQDSVVLRSLSHVPQSPFKGVAIMQGPRHSAILLAQLPNAWVEEMRTTAFTVWWYTPSQALVPSRGVCRSSKCHAHGSWGCLHESTRLSSASM